MKFLMAANWKMYKTAQQAAATLHELTTLLSEIPSDKEVAIFAPFTCLHACAKALQGTKIHLGAQNFYPAEEGAFTGEISSAMLLEAGCGMVLTGHSERRSLFGENDVFIGQKTSYALSKGLSVILCVGETLIQRDAGALTEVLTKQLQAGLATVPKDTHAANISIAYEPVWAIGTGRVAGEAEITEAHAIIRKQLKAMFPEQGENIRILYGGSVKPDNAGIIIALKNVNGVLVGGASLQATSFSQIVLA